MVSAQAEPVRVSLPAKPLILRAAKLDSTETKLALTVSAATRPCTMRVSAVPVVPRRLKMGLVLKVVELMVSVPAPAEPTSK